MSKHAVSKRPRIESQSRTKDAPRPQIVRIRLAHGSFNCQFVLRPLQRKWRCWRLRLLRRGPQALSSEGSTNGPTLPCTVSPSLHSRLFVNSRTICILRVAPWRSAPCSPPSATSRIAFITNTPQSTEDPWCDERPTVTGHAVVLRSMEPDMNSSIRRTSFCANRVSQSFKAVPTAALFKESTYWIVLDAMSATTNAQCPPRPP